jgi:hypothetical protein
MPALATTDDYELLIAPVPDEDEPRLEYCLNVASYVVVTVAPLLYPWVVWPLDDAGDPVDPGPVPPPAVMVTCQAASQLFANPEGSPGPVTMERIGLSLTRYGAPWDVTGGLLPAGWQIILKPWRLPDIAAVRLVVPHPSEEWLGEGEEFWNWWVVEDVPS